MSQTIFSKTATSGKQVEVRAEEHTTGYFIAQVFVDGKYLAGPGQPQALKSPKGEVTHFLGGGWDGTKPGIGLTTAEAQTIESSLTALRAAWEETSAGQAEALRNERERLLATYRGLLEEQEAAFNRLHDREETDAAWAAKNEWEGRVQESYDALRAFSAAHPEIAGREEVLDLPSEGAK